MALTRNLFVFLTIIYLLFLHVELNADMYKWRDSNGVLHFSDEPPTERQQTDSTVKVSSIVDSDDGIVDNRFGMEFKYIPPGTYTMGTSYTTGCLSAAFKLERQVTLTKGFYIQTTEMTQRQWSSVANSTPSYFKSCGGDCPVEMVSWNDIQKFIGMLNQMDSGRRYRLPTEAEWEYAARAGSDAKFCFGDNKKQLHDYGWFWNNSGDRTHPVAKKKPNRWGLYDVHGNVFEYCQANDNAYRSRHPITDPKPVTNPSNYVLRSGSFKHCHSMCWSGSRLKVGSSEEKEKTIGFRLVMDKVK